MGAYISISNALENTTSYRLLHTIAYCPAPALGCTEPHKHPVMLVPPIKNVEKFPPHFSHSCGVLVQIYFDMIALGFNANNDKFNCNLAIPSEIIRDTCK